MLSEKARTVLMVAVVLAGAVIVGIIMVDAGHTYRGRSLSEWINLSRDLDHDTAQVAMWSLEQFHDSERANSRVKEMKGEGYIGRVELAVKHAEILSNKIQGKKLSDADETILRDAARLSDVESKN